MLLSALITSRCWGILLIWWLRLFRSFTLTRRRMVFVTTALTSRAPCCLCHIVKGAQIRDSNRVLGRSTASMCHLLIRAAVVLWLRHNQIVVKAFTNSFLTVLLDHLFLLELADKKLLLLLLTCKHVGIRLLSKFDKLLIVALDLIVEHGCRLLHGVYHH